MSLKDFFSWCLQQQKDSEKILCNVIQSEKTRKRGKIAKWVIARKLPIRNALRSYCVYLPMLCKSKSVWVDLFAEATTVVTDFVFDFGKFGFGLLSNFNHVEFGRNVPY